MGDAKRRQAQNAAQRDKLSLAVAQVSSALRRLATAASSNLGGDCYLHAELGKVLLADLGFPFHAWLESGDWLVDLTTYQFEKKCRELDAADGGHTQLNWRPDYLLLQRKDLKSYKEVARAPDGPLAYYEERPELEATLRKDAVLDPSDVAAARLLLTNPELSVLGPNDFEAA